MPLPIVRKQNAPQVGMAAEYDPKHVVDLPLVPICIRIDGFDGGHLGRAPLQGDTQAQEDVLRQAIKLVDDGEPRLFGPVVYGGQRGEQVEIEGRVVVEDLAGHHDRIPIDDDRRLTPKDLHAEDVRAKFAFQRCDCSFNRLHPLNPSGVNSPEPRSDLPTRGLAWSHAHDQCVSFSPRTLACKVRMPWISPSGRGGQPATYTSTGTISSTPCTMASL